MQDFVNDCSKAMQSKIDNMNKKFSKIKTGRASINVLDGIKIDYYGTPTLINQIASISIPDARTIVISPFEKNMIQKIEKSIMVGGIDLQPVNDGNVIRLPVQPLTGEKRDMIAKDIKNIGEDIKIAVRQVRRDFNDKAKNMEKTKEITQDDLKMVQNDIQKNTDQFISNIDDLVKNKIKEIKVL